jgi:tetratricopeptide (TPR) repeat protein
MASASKDPIQERFDQLFNQWNAFAQDKSARLLRWVAQEDEERMLDVFFDMQCEEASDTPDLFLIFHSPFDDALSFAARLTAELAAQVGESRDQLTEDGINLTWAAPQLDGQHSEPREFCDACLSLRAQLGEIMEHMAIVFRPDQVADTTHWHAWFNRLLGTTDAKSLRYVVVEREDAPLLSTLSEKFPGKVTTIIADLDMPHAAEQLARTGNPKDPGVQFRQRFIELSNLLASENQTEAEKKARQALAIADRQGWLDQQCVIHSMLAAAHLQNSRVDKAIDCYGKARAAAKEAREAKHPAGAKLVMQTYLGEAGALVTDGRFNEAAQAYRSSATAAAEADNGIILVECWRMASFCHEQTMQLDDAWQCAIDGVKESEKLPVDQREMTTLPFLGQGLLRLTSQDQFQRFRPAVERKLAELLGKDWRDTVNFAGSAQ